MMMIMNLVRSSLNIDNFIIICSVIDLILPGGVIHCSVPDEVNRPGCWLPLSHFIVILNWWPLSIVISHPVHDKMIISRIINTKWPWLSPSVIVSIILGLDEGDTWIGSPCKSNCTRSSDKSKNKLHILLKFIL